MDGTQTKVVPCKPRPRQMVSTAVHGDDRCDIFWDRISLKTSIMTGKYRFEASLRPLGLCLDNPSTRQCAGDRDPMPKYTWGMCQHRHFVCDGLVWVPAAQWSLYHTRDLDCHRSGWRIVDVPKGVVGSVYGENDAP